MHGTAPNYLSSLVNFKPNSSYSLRSNNKYLLSALAEVARERRFVKSLQ